MELRAGPAAGQTQSPDWIIRQFLFAPINKMFLYFFQFKTYNFTIYDQVVREGTMDRILNFLESQTLGTGLKGMCTNSAGSD